MSVGSYEVSPRPPALAHRMAQWSGARPNWRAAGGSNRAPVQVSVFSGRLHRIPRTYPRFWAGLRALKLPIYPFFGPAYRPGPPRFIRTAGRPLCVYSEVLPKIGGIGSMAMVKAVRPVPPAMPLVRAVTCSTRLAIGIAPTNKYSRSLITDYPSLPLYCSSGR